MSDWEVVSNEPAQQNASISDWQIVDEQANNIPVQPQESISRSAAMAIPRVGADLITGLYNSIKAIPGVISNAPEALIAGNIEQFKNPKAAAMQGLAGLAEMGHGLINLPHTAANYVSNRLNLIPQSWADQVPYQKDITNDINSLLGAPQNEGQQAIRNIGSNALNILGGIELGGILNPMNLTKNNIIKDVLDTRTNKMSKYENLYNKLWDKADKAGLSDLSHVANKIDINTLRDLTPESKLSTVEDFFNNPTLENAHYARSDLKKLKRNLEKNQTKVGDQVKQESAVKNAIKDLNENMFKNANGEVNNKLVKMYDKITKGYADEVVPYKSPMIRKYLNREKTADQLFNSLNKDTFGARAYSNHPALVIRNNLNLLKNLGLIGGAAGGALYGFNQLRDDLIP